VLFFGLDVRLVKGGQVMDSLTQGIQKLRRGSLISFLQLGLRDLKSFKLDFIQLLGQFPDSRIASRADRFHYLAGALVNRARLPGGALYDSIDFRLA
jgi:hypothetical protein